VPAASAAAMSPTRITRQCIYISIVIGHSQHHIPPSAVV